MGKPSSNHLSRKSKHSFNLNPSYQKIPPAMSSQKIETMRKRKRSRTRNKIRSLFSSLKRESEATLDTSTLSAPLDTSEQADTNENLPLTTGIKRKCATSSEQSVKRKKSDNSVILITDDETNTNVIHSPKRSETHINCSTPINKNDNKTLQNMIINNFANTSNNNDTTQNFNEEVENLTKEINKDSYLTIDLTSDSEFNRNSNTVIDLDKADLTLNTDCSLVSISNASLSISGESDITVLNTHNAKKKEQHNMNKFARGISKLNSSEKGKLLELIAQNIFNGCKMTTDVKCNPVACNSQATETNQDAFIKEVILGESKSRNSVGSNIYHPSKDQQNKKGLRMIVIDGSNVAMEHTKGAMFSVKGLKICIDYFIRRGHVVKAFVPRFRCKYGKSSDPKLLDSLERQGLVVYTPSREIQGRICVPYDDRYIVQCAAEFDGIIVSGDNYRDLLKENPRWRFVIENRLLPFTWVDDMIMFPKDPLGRNGPTLSEFLRHSPSPPTIVL